MASARELEASTASIEKHVQRRIFKIIVIGDSNVGKTCLTFRFCGGSFPGMTEATIGVDFREKQIEVDGETVKVMSALLGCFNVGQGNTGWSHLCVKRGQT